MSKIVTVAAAKGGVGKTTIAYELAYLLNAPLVDLDWDRGGATNQWGYRVEQRMTAPLLDALERNTVPRLVRGSRKPDLIPSHPDFVDNQPAPEVLASALEKWGAEWGSEFVVVDTHPGGAPSTYGAMAAASLIVTPVVLATKELDALEGMLTDVPDYPVMLVPNRVPTVPPGPEVARLRKLAEGFEVAVAQPVSEYRWLGRRKLRRALTSYEEVPARIKPLASELAGVADAVRRYGND